MSLLNESSTGQDVHTCHICGGPLGFAPKLGEWIRHAKCHAAVTVCVREMQRLERNQIADWLAKKSEETYGMAERGGDTQASARLRAIAWQEAKRAVQIRHKEHWSSI